MCLHVCYTSHIAKCLLTISVLCMFFRYIQSLTNNVTFVRYKEVYAAAAEIIGLVLKNMTDMGNV